MPPLKKTSRNVFCVQGSHLHPQELCTKKAGIKITSLQCSEMSNTFLHKTCDLAWVMQAVLHAAATLESSQLLQRFTAYFK